LLFPFLFIVAAKIGGDARPALIRRMGLDRSAANSIDSLMSPGTHAATTLDFIGAIWIVLGGYRLHVAGLVPGKSTTNHLVLRKYGS
jgi:hypothetical protein